eukprot:13152976-Alexandrium_andersonii.AAC.1
MELRSSVSGSFGKIWRVLVLRCAGFRTRDGAVELHVGKFKKIWHMLVLRCTGHRTRDGAAELCVGSFGKYGTCSFSDAQAVAREMELRSSASETSG